MGIVIIAKDLVYIREVVRPASEISCTAFDLACIERGAIPVIPVEAYRFFRILLIWNCGGKVSGTVFGASTLVFNDRLKFEIEGGFFG